MRVWLYDTLTSSLELQTYLGGTLEKAQERVKPRQSESVISNLNLPKPFLIIGLGNNTNESLAEDQDHTAHRQFFQVWIHDEGASYQQIDDMIAVVKKLLTNQQDPASMVTTVHWLETSQEFANETYNTIFRYIRFQAIISKGVPVS